MENNKFDDTPPFGAGVLLNKTKPSDPAFLMAKFYNFIILFNLGDASCLTP